MKFNTRNPVGTDGSTDPRDMYDNAGNLDKFLTSEQPTFPDRLNKTRPTLKGFEIEHQSALDAIIMVSAGDFFTGTVVTARNQTVLWSTANGGNGHEYRWAGALNKTVPAGSTPLTSGGIYPDGLWIDVGVTQLRRDLAPVAGIKHLRPIPGIKQHAESYVEGSGTGGGDFIFHPEMSGELHDGGSVISETSRLLWNGTESDLPTILAWTGTEPGCYVKCDKSWEKIDPFDYGYVLGGIRAEDSMNKFREISRSSSENFIETYVGDVSINTNKFIEVFRGIASKFGRFATKAFRTQWVGDGVQVPGPVGASVSSNMSSLELNQNTYTGGNSEPIHLISRVYGACPHAGSVFDLQLYGGSGQFGQEHVLRDGNIVPTSTISAIEAGKIVINPSETTQYFGASINTRDGISRGYPLLNETKKINVTATLVGRVVSVESTAGILPGYYFGFNADTVAGYPIGIGRHLTRIKEIWNGTQFLLDSELEASSSFECDYQGLSAAGAATVYPATLPSGYNPRKRTFTFKSSLNSFISPVFAVGDAVTQYPCTDIQMIGYQIDLARTANQRVPKDKGLVISNTGKKAFCGTYVAGHPTGPVYAYVYGQYFNNVSVGRYFFSYPQYETDNIQGMKVYHRNQAPTVLGADGIKGSTFHRAEGGIDKCLYVNTADGENYEPVQILKQSGFSAASMPTATTPGNRAFVNELDFSAEWDGVKWTFMGKRVIGRTAQRPTSVWPFFAYYDTDLFAVFHWSGSAWY